MITQVNDNWMTGRELLLPKPCRILSIFIVLMLLASAGWCDESLNVEQLKKQMQMLEKKLEQMQEESEIRRQLEVTEEEKSDTQDDVLSAAGRDYSLMKQGYLGFEYSLKYTGSSYDSIVQNAKVEHSASHSLTNSLLVEFPFKDNITLNANVPFVSKVSSQSNSDAKDVTDFGDVSFGWQWQPFRSGGGAATKIISGSATMPTGRSPYKIDSTREISTGSGGYALSTGLNLSKPIDPLVTFGSINYTHNFDISGLNYKTGTQGEAGIYLEEVQPGDTFSYSMGLGYSLSYKVSLTLSYQYTYLMKTRYKWVGTDDVTSESSMSSVFNIGTRWNITPQRSLNVKLGVGLTNNDPDFSVSVRVPFEYEL